MEGIVVNTFAELHDVMESDFSDKSWYFRGHSNDSWLLAPKAGRETFRHIDEEAVFASWKRQAIEYVTIKPANDWEWLAIAQHHGLATRLLDWTTNPLVAAYFAIRETYTTDALIFATQFQMKIIEPDKNPLKCNKLAVFRPSRVMPRITRQSGLFSIHPNPNEVLTRNTKGLQNLQKIRIPSEARSALRSQLSFYGFNEATMFPDLDGLSVFMNWTIESKEYWNPKNIMQQG